MHIHSVLFIGRRNAARSIMAEACFNSASIIGWRAFSAGWQSQAGVDRLALNVLDRHGFPTDALYSKPDDIFRQTGAPDVDLCIFLDDLLPSNVSQYPGVKEYWRIGDPHGTEDLKQAYEDALGLIMAKTSGLILSGKLVNLAAELRAAG
ncbi:MAG: low molecular weight phosphatase family protein [Rhizobiaceae bacterium]